MYRGERLFALDLTAYRWGRRSSTVPQIGDRLDVILRRGLEPVVSSPVSGCTHIRTYGEHSCGWEAIWTRVPVDIHRRLLSEAGNHQYPRPVKHHYIPASYLRRWTGPDRLLCQYHRPYKKVVARRVSPEGTGYVEDLYALDRADTETRRQLIETGFFRKVDQGGADAINMMLNDQSTEMPEKLQLAWAVFLVSLIQRTPLKVGFFNEYAATVFPDDKTAGPAGLSNFGADLMMSGTVRTKVIDFIMGMKWSLHTLTDQKHDLLTCDSPIFTTNGIQHREGHIYLPLNPRNYFLAVNEDETRQAISAQPDTVATANRMLVEEAFRYVYGTNDKHLRFVENRMAPKDQPFPSKVPIKRPVYPKSARPESLPGDDE